VDAHDRRVMIINDRSSDMLRLYGGYLEEHFHLAAESRCWTLLVRSAPDLPTSESRI
jgi:hypothetical protein